MGFWNRKKEIPAADPNVAKQMDNEMKQKMWEFKATVAGAENANRTVVNFAPPSTQATLTGTVDPEQLKAPKEEDVKPKEKEWIWVEGYKAVNPDMSAKCGEMIYEAGKVYEVEGDVSLCRNGYHFCLKPQFIRQYYRFGRLFKVRAEVEKEEYEKMKEKGFYTYKYKSWLGDYAERTVDKMVARKIELVEEISDYELIKKVWENNPLFVKNETDWWEFITFCDKNKCKAYEDTWTRHIFIKKMVACGFSETIALVLFKRLQQGWTNAERIVEFAEGLTQMNISNDMKMFLITDEVTKWHRDW